MLAREHSICARVAVHVRRIVYLGTDLRQVMLRDIREPQPFLHLFPEPEDVFADPVERYFQHLMPLLSIDLASVNPSWCGRIHVVSPVEATEEEIGTNSKPFYSDYMRENWIGFRLNEHDRYELLGDWRYFELDWKRDAVDRINAAERQRVAYNLGKQRFREYNRLHYKSDQEPEPRTAHAEPIVGQLGGAAFNGNWRVGYAGMPLDQSVRDDVVPVTPSGRRFQFVAHLDPGSYAQNDGAWMTFGAGTTLLFFEPHERIALQTFDYT